MKKKSTTLFTLLGLSFSSALFAQRSIDMEATLISPAKGQEVVIGQPFDVVLQLKNKGPESLIEGDTVIVLYGNQVLPIVLSVPLLAGESGELVKGTSSLGNGTVLGPVQFCLEIADINSLGVQSEGKPLKVSYDDPNLGNNMGCNEIKVVASGGTSSLLEQQSIAGKVRLYPNPAVNDVTIQIEEELNTAVVLNITDMGGRVLLHEVYPASAMKDGSLVLNTAQLPTGILFVHLKYNSKTITQKLTLMK